MVAIVAVVIGVYVDEVEVVDDRDKVAAVHGDCALDADADVAGDGVSATDGGGDAVVMVVEVVVD